MSDTEVSEKHDEWVSSVFNADPRKYDAKNAPPSADPSGSFLDDAIDTVKEAASDVYDKGAEVVEDVEQTVEDVVDKGKEVVEDVVDKGKEVVEDVKQTAEDLVDKGKEVVEDVVDKGKEVVEDVKQTAEDLVDKGKEIVEDVVDKGKEIVQEVEDTAGDLIDKGKKIVSDAIDEGKKVVQEVEDTAKDLIDEGVKTVKEIEQAIEDKVKEIAKKIADGVKPSPTTPPSTPPSTPTPTAPKPTLTSETEVSSPGNRARTKLGIGERVTLSVTPGPGNWTAPGATLSSKTGAKVTMTAPTRPGNVEVTVDVGGQTASIKFTVIAPSSVHQDVTSTEHYNVGVPNAGFHALIYLGPADVNFNAVTFTESEIGCKASGSWISKDGEGHSPNPSPLPCTSTVVAGKGTKTGATDHCWSGYVPGLSLTDWTGEMSWAIPWNWQCGSSSGSIGKFTQRVSTAKDGSTTITKAGASFTAALS